MCKTKTKVEAFVTMIMYKFFACILLYSNNIENIFFFQIYSATKYALRGFMDALYLELQEQHG